MSDYEILMIVLTVCGLLIAVWSGKKITAEAATLSGDFILPKILEVGNLFG